MAEERGAIIESQTIREKQKEEKNKRKKERE